MFAFLLLSSLLSLALAENGCYPGAILSLNGNKCFHVMDFKAQFAAAEEACSGFGGHLASVHNKWDMDMLIVSMRVKKFWLGGQLVNSKWTWNDGSVLDYTNWAQNEPNDYNCLQVDSQRLFWSSEECTKEAHFVCETSPIQLATSTTPEPTTPTATPCPDTAKIHYVLLSQLLDWNAAEAFCKTIKGHLVSIHDDDTEKLIDTYVNSEANKSVWIGGQVASGGRVLTWSDGSADDTETWADSMPKVTAGTTCVMATTDGWHNVDCNKKLAAVCQIPVDGATQSI